MTQIQSITDPAIFDTHISRKYQTVIPAKIRHALNLKAGDKLSWRVIRVGDKQKILAEPRPKNWTEYSLGLGEEIWKNVNIDDYIDNLRDEWRDQQ